MIKLFRFLIPYTAIIIIGLVLLYGQAISELYLPNLMSDMINNGMMQGDTNYVLSVGAKMLGFALLSSFAAISANFVSSKIAMGFGRDVRNAIFTKIEGYSLHEFDKIGTASLITRTTNDVVQVQSVMAMGFRFILYSPVLCIGGMIMAYHEDAAMSIIIAVAVPSLILTMVIVARFVIPLFQSFQKKLDTLNLTLRESLTGIRVIRAFNKMDVERKRFYDANKDLTDTSIKINKIMASAQPLMMFLMNLTMLAIIWFGGIRISRDQMNIGGMMAFMQYAMQILFSIIMVAFMFMMIPRAQVSAARINEVLDLDPEIFDPKVVKKTTGLTAVVEFKNVNFAYPGAESPALENISFKSQAGEITAIIGGTGSGKTTLINLIPRFYDVSGGSVLVDGVDVKELAQEELRGKVGFVPQGSVLFTGTISENIRFGNKDATDEEVQHAAMIAQATDFVSKMDDGFESEISQGGTNVSGGQKQRLSIARAIVRKPEIFIFDDSFSALDFKTDAKLRAALKDEITKSTVILVAQRITTVMDADRILVLDEGKIVGSGTHRELLKTCDVYKEICFSQLSEEELA